MEVGMAFLAIACLLGLSFCSYSSQISLHDGKLSHLFGHVGESTLALNAWEEEEVRELHGGVGKERNYISLEEEEEGKEEDNDDGGGSGEEEENKKESTFVIQRYGFPKRRMLQNVGDGSKTKKKKKEKKKEKKKNILIEEIRENESEDDDDQSKKTKIQDSSTNGGKRMNQIDACWRNDRNWANNRQNLAGCIVGFGHGTLGGKGGSIYVVNDTSDDPINPKIGTLRYGATRTKALWIIFARDMSIKLKNELMITSYKTIDGRGAKVEIANGQCIALRHVSHVIIHNIHIHHCKRGKKGPVRSNETHIGQSINGSDGDGIVVFDSKNIWIDHNSLNNCNDGLIDVVHASTSVTISNNYLSKHDKVMMLGHDDNYLQDKTMKVTVVYNYFGPGLVQRMPRCRWGYFHVANNHYNAWKMYAIGGSANSTIRSEANYFFASKNSKAKKVTKREVRDPSAPKSWNWRSINDLFLNGAVFEQSGSGTAPPNYTSGSRFTIQSANLVPTITASAGAMNCKVGSKC